MNMFSFEISETCLRNLTVLDACSLFFMERT
uniref:Uncharacterized protein n=1 Tax=Rhizophora mucronata TaxID=61149 RepID=A0A2P2QJM3_RHIMU